MKQRHHGEKLRRVYLVRRTPGSGLRLKSVATLGVVRLLFLLLKSLDRLFVLGKLTANSARLLAAQIQGYVLLAAESSTKLGLLVLVVHRQYTSDRLADDANLAQLGGSTTNDLGHTKLSKLLLVVVQLTQQLSLAFRAKLVRLDLDCKSNSNEVTSQCLCLQSGNAPTLRSQGRQEADNRAVMTTVAQ